MKSEYEDASNVSEKKYTQAEETRGGKEEVDGKGNESNVVIMLFVADETEECYR